MVPQNDSPPRVLVIGWDGATFKLLRPLAERGILPNLRGLMARGSSGPLGSTIPPLSAPAWVSIMTGKNPGKHGCLLFATESDQPPYGLRVTDATTIDGATLWTLIGSANKRVVSVNVPMTYPPQGVNGILISGFTTPSQSVAFTYPPELKTSPLLKDYLIEVGYETSNRQSGTDAVGPTIADRASRDPDQFLQSNIDLVKRRTQTCKALMAQEEWDLFFLVFTSLDRISHYFWSELAALAAGEGADSVRCGTLLVDYLRALDSAVEELMLAAGDDRYVLVISDHGFGPVPSKVFFLNTWLEQKGLLAAGRTTQDRKQVDLNKWLYLIRRSKSLTLSLMRFMPMSLKRSLRERIDAQRVQAVDHTRSQAYAVPMAANVGGLRISAHISSGERQRLVAQLEGELMAIRDSTTKEPIVAVIHRREAIYDGPHVEEYPDLVFFLTPDYMLSRALVPGDFLSPALAAPRTGDHTMEGVFVLHGPGVLHEELQGGWQVTDVPATVLYLLGLGLPDDIDGRVIEEAFESSFLAAHEIRHTDSSGAQQTFADSHLTDVEEELVVSRLRGLGYVD